MLKTGYFCLPPMRSQTNVELAVLDPRSEEHCRNAIGTPANENLHNWPQVVELDPSGSCELDLVSDTSSTPPEDELVICYARYCSTRARVRLQKKNSEICHICYFKFGRVKSLLESNMEEHVSVKHHMDGFLCEARGCMVRAETRANAGLHQFFCHEQDKDEWWKEYLKDAPTR
uniref:Uncharacterized protein n=1 Tax=Arundo donax TaxID=35708 RepID=A0A0A8XRP5_ARUDO